MKLPDLIVPICGESKRYPGDIPKWALKKNNKSMLQMSVTGISGYDRLFVIHLKKHRELVKQNCPENAILIELEKQTQNQCETIYKGLQYIDSENFVVKDCDNYAELELRKDNFVGYYRLQRMTWMNVSNKSYLDIDRCFYLKQMIEKCVISTTFGIGVYGIHRNLFCNIFLRNKPEYFSQVMNIITHNGNKVTCVEAKDYIDWGTIHDWNQYSDYYFSQRKS